MAAMKYVRLGNTGTKVSRICIATSRGVSMAQVAMAWVSRHPAVTAPIVGATKMVHLEDAVASLAIELTAEEVRALEAPYLPHEVAGF